MFTDSELKEILLGLDLKIQREEKIYFEKMDKAQSVGFDISKAYQNSIDYMSHKIKQLKDLRKKVLKEINR